MEHELYFVDEAGLLKLIGFGPAEGNKGTPPVRAILNDQVFTCEYYTGERIGEKADIYFPTRNYILADEFHTTGLIDRVEKLIKNGDEFIMDVGEGWTDERTFIWKRESKAFSKKFKVQKAIRVSNWSNIARALQAYNELVFINQLPIGREKPKTNKEIDIARQIQELFSLESSFSKFDRSDKKPNLDQTDNTFI